MIVVVDTSVAVKWYVAEEDDEQAKQLLVSGSLLVAPDLLWAETGNVLRRRVRLGDISDIQAAEGVRALGTAISHFIPSAEIIDAALRLSSRLDHSVYDCMYLAAALSDDEHVLVTADLRFAAKAQSAGYGDRILTLEAAAARFAMG